ncbi:MAG: hypothetical protein ACKOFU_02580, partial [Actinomycetota bacterium]
MFKRVGFAILLLSFMVAGVLPSKATFTVPDDLPIAEDLVSQTIVVGGAFGNDAFSWIQASVLTSRSTGLGGSNHLCNSFDEENCRSKDAIIGQIVLPPCSTGVRFGCIDALAIGKSSSTLKPATLLFEGSGDQ